MDHTDPATALNALEQRTEAVRLTVERLDRGTYGSCDRCGQPIDTALLDTTPTLPTCSACDSAGDSAT